MHLPSLQDLQATLRCEETVCTAVLPPARIPLVSLEHIAVLLGRWKSQGTPTTCSCRLVRSVCSRQLLAECAARKDYIHYNIK